MKKEKDFLNISNNKLNKTTLHSEKKILYPEAEKELMNFIEFNRKFNNPVSKWAILLKLYKLVLERKSKTIKVINYIFIDF